MKTRRYGWAVVVVGVLATLSLTHGQDRSASSPPPQRTIQPVAARVETLRPAVELKQLTPLEQQFFVTARRGADWLRRANRPDGRFVPGYLPDLKTTLEGDS